ncbi:MAG: hypothetical protein HDS08_02900 [Bacteroides sp.]|nr:hypothetical protein [Bacteroides sp.]
MKKLLFLIVTVFVCSFAAYSQDLPESWDKMYMNGGQFEYCSTSFKASGAEITITLLKEEMNVEYIGKSLGNQVSMDFNGVIVNGELSELDKTWSFTIPYSKEFEEALAKTTSGLVRISFKGNEGSVVTPFSGKAVKEMNQAVVWARENSF